MTRALAESSSLEEASPRLLQAVCVVSNFQLGELWTVDAERNVLTLAGTWLAPRLPASEFAGATRFMTYLPGGGVPGRVWASAKPLWIADLEMDAGLVRQPEVQILKMKSVMAAPIRQGMRPVGTLAFYSLGQQSLDKDVLELADVLGNQVGDFMRRREAEAKVLQTAHRFRAMIENSSDAIVLFDRSGRITYASPATRRILGMEGDELLSRESFGQVFESDREYVDQQFLRIQQRPVEPVRIEFRTKHKDGKWVWVEGIGQNLLDDADVHRVVWNFRDVTARHNAEEDIRKLNDELEERVRMRTIQLQEMNKELEAFSYSISHDLRSPLRAIDGFSRELLEHKAEMLDVDARRYIDVIRQKTRSMGQLIDDLLSYARVSRAELQRAFVDLTLLAHEVSEELLQMEPNKNVMLKVGELGTVRGTRPLLRQVLINLVSNALKFSRARARPEVEIGRSTMSNEEVFFVRDNGLGFDVTQADRLFGLFQRQHSASEVEGTGVGLAIVQRIVHRHGGRVWADATPQKGATFFFTLSQEAEE